MDLYEEKIIMDCKKGKKEAFDLLIRKYADKVYNIAVYITRNKEDAKDISQEIFIKIYRNIASFQGGSGIGTWIYSIALNTSRDYLRKVTALNKITQNTAETKIENNDPQNAIETKEMNLLINEAMGRLGDNEKEILVLKDIMGFTYEEISGILDINCGTVKSRLSRARCSLREKLQGIKDYV